MFRIESEALRFYSIKSTRCKFWGMAVGPPSMATRRTPTLRTCMVSLAGGGAMDVKSPLQNWGRRGYTTGTQELVTQPSVPGTQPTVCFTSLYNTIIQLHMTRTLCQDEDAVVIATTAGPSSSQSWQTASGCACMHRHPERTYTMTASAMKT